MKVLFKFLAFLFFVTIIISTLSICLTAKNKILVAKQDLENIEITEANIEEYFELKYKFKIEQDKTPFNSYEDLKNYISLGEADFFEISLKKNKILYKEDIKNKFNFLVFTEDLIKDKIYSLEDLKEKSSYSLKEETKIDLYFLSYEDFFNTFEKTTKVYFETDIKTGSLIKKDNVKPVDGNYSPNFSVYNNFHLIPFANSSIVDLIFALVGFLSGVVTIFDFLISLFTKNKKTKLNFNR